jgi:competence protein ComEC
MKEWRRWIMNKRRLWLLGICVVFALAAAIQPGYALTGSQNSSDVVEAVVSDIADYQHDVSVMFTNVGYGDATLVQIDGNSYLIDTGSKASVPQLLGALAMCGVEKLEAVFLTHTHSDHIGGMEALASQYAIGTLYSAEISEDKKNGENKIDLLAAELSLNHIKLMAGDTINLSADAFFDVLGPVVYNNEDDNDNSLVLRLGVNGRVFLFTGDMQFAEEGTLLAVGADVRADVLKVGNHGNPDATSPTFAAAVTPSIAVISTSTVDDADSANERVISLFDGARVLVTEDFTRGALLYVSASGEIEISNPQPPSPGADIEIVEIDKNAQTITLINNGTELDISGYMIFSQKGSEIYVFPQGTVIKASQVLTIACTGGDGDLIWNEKKVWHVKKDDAGVLYDSFGNELSRSP